MLSFLSNFNLDSPLVFYLDFEIINRRFFLDRVGDFFSLEEKKEIENHFNLENKIKFLVKRTLLKIILGHYLHLNPKDVFFNHNQYGKPFVGNKSDLSLDFNLSDVNNKIVFCLYKNIIGIDVEYIFRKNNYIKIANRYLHKEEYKSFQKETNLSEKRNIFYRYWVKKEAYIKYLGMGLAKGLSTFSVDEIVDENLIFDDLDLPWKNHLGCVCFSNNESNSLDYKLQYCNLNEKLDREFLAY